MQGVDECGYFDQQQENEEEEEQVQVLYSRKFSLVQKYALANMQSATLKVSWFLFLRLPVYLRKFFTMRKFPAIQ